MWKGLSRVWRVHVLDLAVLGAFPPFSLAHTFGSRASGAVLCALVSLGFSLPAPAVGNQAMCVAYVPLDAQHSCCQSAMAPPRRPGLGILFSLSLINSPLIGVGHPATYYPLSP